MTASEKPEWPGFSAALENPELLEQYRQRLEAWQQTPDGQAEMRAEAERERQAEQQEREEARRRERKRLEAAGIPRRVRDLLEGGNLTASQALTRAKQWREQQRADSSRWCLVLSADKGAGKTVAAGWWMAESDPSCPSFWDRKRGEDVVLSAWWTAPQLCRVNAYGPEFDALCSHPGPIVLDDLGSEYSDKAGFMQVMIDSLVDARYSEYRPLLITTNLTAKSFRERYGERVTDRLREGGAFFEFREKSMRGAA